MRPTQDLLHSILKCPCAADSSLTWSKNCAVCGACGREYPVIDQKPVLIRFERSVARESDFVAREGRSEVRRPGRVPRIVSSLIFGCRGRVLKTCVA
jgi:uncharacterized protein YbaR (Trm112 family)